MAARGGKPEVAPKKARERDYDFFFVRVLVDDPVQCMSSETSRGLAYRSGYIRTGAPDRTGRHASCPLYARRTLWPPPSMALPPCWRISAFSSPTGSGRGGG